MATTSKPKVTKKKGTDMQPETGVVIQNIQIRPVVRTSQDIEKWRSALVNAEGIHPTRVPLYDLYADLLLDPVLSSVIEKRILGVTKTKLLFLDSEGKEVDEIKTLLSCAQFRELRKEVMLAKFWGVSVVELIKEFDAFRIFSADRKHIRTKEGKIVNEQYGEDGIYYRVPPVSNFVLEVGKWNDLGLILKAAPYVIYKRGGFGDWANFAEIFGMPFREARYDGFNPVVRQQLEDALQAAGSASYAILPKEAQITFHEAKSTNGTGQLYDMLRKACNEELSILILGQTETTTSSDSSGYAQSKTHADVEADINSNDKDDELSIFNELVKPILSNLGYAVDNGTFAHETKEEEVPLKDMVDIVIKLKNNAKLPIEDEYLYELTGIPKPAKYNQIKAQQEAEAQLQQQQQDVPPNDPPKPAGGKKQKTDKKLSWVELYGNALNDFFADGQQ